MFGNLCKELDNIAGSCCERYNGLFASQFARLIHPNGVSEQQVKEVCSFRTKELADELISKMVYNHLRHLQTKFLKTTELVLEAIGWRKEMIASVLKGNYVYFE